MRKQHLGLGTQSVDLSVSWDVLYLFVIVTPAFCALFWDDFWCSWFSQELLVLVENGRSNRAGVGISGGA